MSAEPLCPTGLGSLSSATQYAASSAEYIYLQHFSRETLGGWVIVLIQRAALEATLKKFSPSYCIEQALIGKQVLCLQKSFPPRQEMTLRMQARTAATNSEILKLSIISLFPKLLFFSENCVLFSQSSATLCNSMGYSLPGSSVHRVLQARILKWIVMTSSRGSSQPRDQIRVSCIADSFFTAWAISEAFWLFSYTINPNLNLVVVIPLFWMAIREKKN